MKYIDYFTKRILPALVLGLILTPFLAQAHAEPTGSKVIPWNYKSGNSYYLKKKQDYNSCGKIVKVINGNTLYITLEGVITRVRLLDVDVPKLDTPEGRAIKIYVVELAEGKEACLKYDNMRGYYGRLQAEVYIDGESLADTVRKKMHIKKIKWDVSR